MPIPNASDMASMAWVGPIEITIAFPPKSFFNVTANPIACLSSGLIMLSSPSLIRLPVFGSILISVVSGTCFISTMIFIHDS